VTEVAAAEAAEAVATSTGEDDEAVPIFFKGRLHENDFFWSVA
jgi:hypothetical protein